MKVLNALEVVMVVAFAAAGARSMVWWWRHPFEAVDVTDHFLYALYLTGRTGMWFAFAGVFVIFASINTRGRAFVDDANDFRWYLMVFVVLGAMQFVGGQLLGRRRPGAALGSEPATPED